MSDGCPEPEPVISETMRVEAFSDAVFAIAITLLGLELKRPQLVTVTAEGFRLALIRQWPAYVAFCTSFATILIIWINHHGILQLTRRSDRRFLLANGLLLLLVTTVPFSTSCLANYLTTPAGNMAAGLYAGTFVLINLAFLLLWQASASQSGALMPHISTEHARHISVTLGAALPIYLMATAVAYANAYASITLCATLLLIWALFSYDYRPMGRQRVRVAVPDSGPRRLRIAPWGRTQAGNSAERPGGGS